MMDIPKRYFVSSYSQAPDRLSDAMARLDDLLRKSEANGAKPEALKFYKDILETMRFSFHYMMDVYWIIDRNSFLEAENVFMKKWAGEQMRRLEIYEGIREAISSGEIDPMMKAVHEAIEKGPEQQNP